MSAEVSNLSKAQTYNYNPKSRENLKMWKPGVSANPGGLPKNQIHADATFNRLGALELAQLRKYKPKHVVEGAIKRSLIAANSAKDWQEANAALKQLILCLDGSPKKTVAVEFTATQEAKDAIINEAYYRLFSTKTREEALSAINAIYDAAEDERREVIALAVAKEAEEISLVWEEASAAVMGNG